jgi:glutathione S-transferase
MELLTSAPRLQGGAPRLILVKQRLSQAELAPSLFYQVGLTCESAKFVKRMPFLISFPKYHSVVYLVPTHNKQQEYMLQSLLQFCAITTYLIMASSTDSVAPTKRCEWTICYHQAAGKTLKGRGEFLRLLLEDAGVEYNDSGENLYGPTGMMDGFRGSTQAIDTEAEVGDPSKKFPFPVFFPPAIWHSPRDDGDQVLINQVGACVMYLGEMLGYAPVNAAERARANSIMLNALDYMNEGRNSFHPVKNSMSYVDQKEEADKASKVFSTERMPLFLHHFNKIVGKTGGPHKPIAGGEGVTYADFCLFHVLDATVHQFNSDYYEKAWDTTNVPDLKEYYEWMKSRPNLQAYFKSDRCPRKYSVERVFVFLFLFVGRSKTRSHSRPPDPFHTIFHTMIPPLVTPKLMLEIA